MQSTRQIGFTKINANETKSFIFDKIKIFSPNKYRRVKCRIKNNGV